MCIESCKDNLFNYGNTHVLIELLCCSEISKCLRKKQKKIAFIFYSLHNTYPAVFIRIYVDTSHFTVNVHAKISGRNKILLENIP